MAQLKKEMKMAKKEAFDNKPAKKKPKKPKAAVVAEAADDSDTSSIELADLTTQKKKEHNPKAKIRVHNKAHTVWYDYRIKLSAKVSTLKKRISMYGIKM